jgi:hypothetical protein
LGGKESLFITNPEQADGKLENLFSISGCEEDDYLLALHSSCSSPFPPQLPVRAIVFNP